MGHELIAYKERIIALQNRVDENDRQLKIAENKHFDHLENAENLQSENQSLKNQLSEQRCYISELNYKMKTLTEEKTVIESELQKYKSKEKQDSCLINQLKSDLWDLDKRYENTVSSERTLSKLRIKNRSWKICINC